MKRNVLSLVLAMGLSSGAFAATQTLVGDHVTFSFDDTLLGLFGTPGVVGDTLLFSPTTFSAKSLDGMGSGFANSTLNVIVTAKNGFTVQGADLTEEGDYWLKDPVGPSSLGVDVSGQLRVRDMANTAHAINDSISSTAPLTTIGTSSIDWTANADASFASWQAKSVKVTIENLLYAFTTKNPSLAFIEKKYVGLTVSVPEPETYAMLLAGLGMVGVIARRRRQS